MPQFTQIELPALAGQGLKAINVKGDGNCLFRALSDQMCGHEGRHEQIRAKVVNYMRENSDDYKPFHIVDIARGARRNEKRGTRAKYSTEMPSTSAHNISWKKYLVDMGKFGTYGTQLEVRAFAKAYHIDVKIHLEGTTHASHDYTKAEDDPKAAPCKVVHLAFKNAHYQSVRNINGPHTGPARTVPYGWESFKERMDKYLSGSGSSSSEESATSGSTSPPTSTFSRDPGLAFLDDYDDDSSEDEKKPSQKSVAKKPAIKVDDLEEFPALGSTPGPAKKSTPAPAPYRDPGLAFLDDFSDYSDSEDEKKPVVKKSVVKNPVEKKEPVKKGPSKKPVPKPAPPSPPTPTPSPASSKKRSQHENISFLGSDSDSSDSDDDWYPGKIDHGIKRVKIGKNDDFPNLMRKETVPASSSN